MNKLFNLPRSPDVDIINRIILSEPKTQKRSTADYNKLTLCLKFKGNVVPRCSYPVCQCIEINLNTFI